MPRVDSIVRLMLLALLVSPLSAYAQEWTRFRGPNGTGLTNTEFPAKPAPGNIAWNTELPGGGHSSPVIWGDKVFVTCADDSSALRMVVCLSAKTGAIEWKKEYGSHAYAKHQDNSYASSTPTVDAERVYVCWSTPEEFSMIALTHSGTEVWKTDLGPFVSQHGSGNSPILVGDLLLFGDDQDKQDKESHLFGINPKTGKIVWQTPRKSVNYSAATPVIFHPKTGPDTVVFSSQGAGLTGVDSATGKIMWETDKVFDSRTVGSPTTAAGLIFAACGEGPGGHVLVAVKPGEEKKATVAWKTKSNVPYVVTPVVKDDLIYYWADRGILTCADAATGKVVYSEHVPGAYYSSPIIAGNTIFNMTKQGDLVAVTAGKEFKLLGKTAFKEKCQASLAVSGGLMFIRTYTHVICIKSTGGQASIDLAK